MITNIIRFLSIQKNNDIREFNTQYFFSKIKNNNKYL